MVEDYKGRHIAFVSGLNGTTTGEVQAAGLIGPLCILLRNLAVPWLFPMKTFKMDSPCDVVVRLLMDLCFTVYPIQCAVTVFSSHLSVLLAVLFLFAAAIALFCWCEYFYSDRKSPPFFTTLNCTDVFARSEFELYSVTYFRAYASVATAVCILAVDFPMFPRRFAKTETYGYSIMDAGVGMFIVANGLVSDEARSNTIVLRLRSLVPLLVLGFARLLSVKLSGYHEHVSEYGVHWNFFFTLALVKAVSSCLGLWRKWPNYCGFAGLFVIIVYQYQLSLCGLRDVLMFGNSALAKNRDNRTGFFNANREGLLSSIGYLSLHLLSSSLGKVLYSKGRSLRQKLELLVQLLFILCVIYVVWLGCDCYIEAASRRIANITYVAWIMLLAVEQVVAFLIIEVLMLLLTAFNFPLYRWSQEEVSPFHLLEPCLWRAINFNPLVYFLLANILTGLVNTTLHTLDVSTSYASVILLVYMSVLSLITYRLYLIKLRVKLYSSFGHKPQTNEIM